MKQQLNLSFRKLLVASVSALAVVTVSSVVETSSDLGFGATKVFAQQGSGNGGSGQGGSGQGGSDQGGHDDGGHDDDGHDDGGNDGGSKGEGAGGQGKGGEDKTSSSEAGDDDSDGRGPKYGQPSGDSGGKPSWAQEGIPEVELGRLNVIRSPDHVLERALAEVITNFDPATMEALYEMSAASFASYVEANWDTITIIDSPLENLAVLENYWKTGDASLPGVSPASTIDYAAILIGAASDKNVPISSETVEALATIIGVSINDATIDAIASRAEVVRLAILAGHG